MSDLTPFYGTYRTVPYRFHLFDTVRIEVFISKISQTFWDKQDNIYISVSDPYWVFNVDADLDPAF